MDYSQWGPERLDAIEADIVSKRAAPDTMWNRGAAGTPLFHNAPGQHVASVEIEMGQKIMSLVIERKPSVLVEVGTNRGFSTTWQMLGMLRNQMGHLTTFDPDPVLTMFGGAYWMEFGLPKELVTYAQKPVWDNPPELPQSIDFVFHDASHDVEPTKLELDALAPRMSKGGVIAFHDIFLCRHMGEVCLEFFKANKGEWDYLEWQYGRGLGIATKK